MNTPYVFKVCSKCGKLLPANTEYFYKREHGKNGLRGECKNCKKQITKKHAQSEKGKENRKKYQQSEKCKESKKKYNQSEKGKESKKKYNQSEKGKAKIKAYEESEKGKEVRKKTIKKYRQSEKGKVNKFNERNKRRNKESNQGKGITTEQWKDMMEAFDWKCAYSGEKMVNGNKSNGRTIDHIIALENGGVNEIWNLIPMKKGYNSSKKDRIDTLNWYKEQEYFSEERLMKIIKWQIYAYIKWATKDDKPLILITNQMEVI